MAEVEDAVKVACFTVLAQTTSLSFRTNEIAVPSNKEKPESTQVVGVCYQLIFSSGSRSRHLLLAHLFGDSSRSVNFVCSNSHCYLRPQLQLDSTVTGLSTETSLLNARQYNQDQDMQRNVSLEERIDVHCRPLSCIVCS